MTFAEAYRFGMHCPMLSRVIRDLHVSEGACRRGLRSAAMFRLLAGGLLLGDVRSVLGD